MQISDVMKPILSAAFVGCLTFGLAPSSAVAANTTTTFAVSATVQATCLVSATPMAFGTYTGAITTSTSTVSVTCTNTTPYNVGLNAGTATSATVTTRKMTGPSGSLLSYSLTSDTAHSVNWGQTVGTDTVAGTGTGSAQALTVYGQVAAGQYVAPGAYADTITATVSY
jgi:spore coat protein U-like protein